MYLIKCLVVIQSEIPINSTLSVIPICIIGLHCIRYFLQIECSITFITMSIINGRHFFANLGSRTYRINVDQSCNTQSGSYHLQILIELHRDFIIIGIELAITRHIQQYIRTNIRFISAISRCLPCGVHQRYCHRSQIGLCLPQYLTVVSISRIILSNNHSLFIQRERSGGSDIHIHIGTEIKLVVIYVRIVFVYPFVLLKNSIFCRKTSTDVITSHFTTSRCTQEVLLVPGIVFQDNIPPIHIRMKIRIHVISKQCQIHIRINRNTSTCHGSFVGECRIFRSTYIFGHLRRIRNTSICLHLQIQLSRLTLLGTYQYYTVGTTHTINRRRRGILQDRETFDVFGVERIQVTFDTVNQYQGTLSGTKGTNTTHPELGEILTRLSTTCNGNDARNTSAQHVAYGSGRSFQRSHLNSSNGTCHINLLLYLTRCRNHNLVHYIRTLLQHHAHALVTLVHLYLLRIIPHIGYDQRMPGFDTPYLETTVNIRNGTHRRNFLYRNRYSD